MGPRLRGDGASRAYNELRLRITRGADVTRPPRHYSSTCYTKTTGYPGSSDPSPTALQQGPQIQRCRIDTTHHAQAGDRVAIEWSSQLQTSRWSEIVAAQSEIGVEIAQ